MNILSRKSNFIKNADEKQEQTMLWANQNKQLKYTHCRITQIEELLNEQIRKKISRDKFTRKIINEINKHLKIKVPKKLLFLINKTKDEKAHTTMQTMSKKQIKKT